MKDFAPYRLFFPLGLLNALLAVGVWFVQDLAWFESPVLLIHSKLIAGGFLWSFITGFLMTAVPRMSGTASARPTEIAIAFGLIAAETLSSWIVDPRFFFSFQIGLIAFLLFYGGRRILAAKKTLPIFFPHVGLALLLALAGSCYHWVGSSWMGLHLYHLGATLLLILGIGARFFSFLSGLPSEIENETSRAVGVLFNACGVGVAVSLFCAGKGMTTAYLALAGLALVYLLKIWRVQRPSDRPSALKHAMRLASSLIPLGFFMAWWFPVQIITWLHLIFIGCFALVTLSVASRVTLAHGAYPLALEMKSRALWWMLGLLGLALASRMLYGFSEGLWRKSFLHLAATFWFLAILVWAREFVPKIFRNDPGGTSSC